MADPLSVAASCIAVIGAAGSTAKAILSFIKDCREARSDLTNISRELTDLQITLEVLKNDGESDALPTPLRSQIVSMVNSCGSVISDIDNVLKRHKGRSGALRWATDGKREVEGLRQGLETYRASLSLTVEAVTLSLATSIKSDTEAIRDQTSAISLIKDDTERILDGIQELRISILPREQQMWSMSPLLDDYLDGLTSYAETVCEEIVWESEIDEGEEDDDESKTTTTNDMDGRDTDSVRGSRGENADEIRQSESRDVTEQRTRDDSERQEDTWISPATHGVSSDEGDRSRKDSEEGYGEREEQTEELPVVQSREEKKPLAAKISESESGASSSWKSWDILKRPEDRCHRCLFLGTSMFDFFPKTMRHIHGNHKLCKRCIRQNFASSISSNTNLALNRPRCCVSEWLLPIHAEEVLDRTSKVQYNRQYRRVSFVCPIKGCGRRHEIASDATRRWEILCRHTLRGVCSWCFGKWHDEAMIVCEEDGKAQQLFDLTSKSSKS